MNDFLNDYGWQPGGYISAADEAAQQFQYVRNNVRQVAMSYSFSNNFTDSGKDVGDEHYGGDSFQYIPTEVEIGAAVAMQQMASAGELPVHTTDPGVAQLLQRLYQQASNFWQDVRNASGTGW